MIDNNEFFRQMTFRICSTLDIEVALQRCYDYLTTVMPVYALGFVFFDSEINHGGVVTEIKQGQPEKSFQFGIEELLFHDEQLIALLRDFWRNMDDMVILNHPDESEFSREMFRLLEKADRGPKGGSHLFMLLELENERLGVMRITTKGYHRFTPKHTELLSLLNEPFAIALSNALRFHEISALKNKLVEDNRLLRQKLNAPQRIIGSEFGLRRVMEMVQEVSAMNSPVLLMGETGTGKEVIANTIHNSSPRRGRSFIKVNCGAIPESLIDSELFGHEKGAFTGALTRKIGYFERSDEGTIFLDEIGELPLAAQVRLLRVLQSQEFERVGGTHPVKINTRIIAATNRNLQDMISEGTFREDLWFRLNVFPIFIPPLRQRREDIPNLTLHFLRKKAEEMNLPVPEIEPGTFERLSAYCWRGNVRELENVVERSLIRHHGGPLHIDLGENRTDTTRETPPTTTVQTDDPPPESLDKAMAEHIRRALAYTKGKISGPLGAAQLLGLHHNTLRHRMTKLGIPFEKQGKGMVKEQTKPGDQIPD